MMFILSLLCFYLPELNSLLSDAKNQSKTQSILPGRLGRVPAHVAQAPAVVACLEFRPVEKSCFTTSDPGSQFFTRSTILCFVWKCTFSRSESHIMIVLLVLCILAIVCTYI